MGSDPRQAGLDVRRAMFGPEHAERALERATDFTRPMQELVTKYCFGEVWTREELPRNVRSMITLAILVGLGRPDELKVHVKGALANGVTKDELREVLLHSMVYCGIPAGVSAFRQAAEVLREVDLEPAVQP